MEMLLLDRIMKVMIMFLNSNKARRNKPLMLLSLMMKTGSLMRISTSNFTIHTILRNLMVKILKQELQLLMMTSQDKFALKILKVLKFPQLNKFAM